MILAPSDSALASNDSSRAIGCWEMRELTSLPGLSALIRFSTRARNRGKRDFGRTISSIPIQFCPADWLICQYSVLHNDDDDVLDTSEQGTCKEVDIGRRKNECWVLTTELDTSRYHYFGCGRSNFLSDRLTSNDC